uniref:T-cell surface glycoprotein CD3 zeta chain n=1 Tax=Oreochromis niloticus TaxID=8128 RepID=A0A669DNZ2_ORENI
FDVFLPYSALAEPQICYILDGILFLYGIILTALYCKVKISNAKEAAGKGKPKGVRMDADTQVHTLLTQAQRSNTLSKLQTSATHTTHRSTKWSFGKRPECRTSPETKMSSLARSNLSGQTLRSE